MSVATIFIDGEAGTTGLQIRERLAPRTDVRIVSIAADKRKDAGERKRLLNEADVAILCLPDDAAIEAVSLIENPDTRVIDASTAHRTMDGWAYGFAEMSPDQAGVIAASKRVANPGCFPHGLIAVVRPLIEAGLMSASTPVTMNAVSGYSGGGRKMIEDYEAAADPAPVLPYALSLKHKHLPEMTRYGRLARAPLFQPSVGNFAQGMLTVVPLMLDQLSPGTTVRQIHDLLSTRYAGEAFVSVAPYSATERTPTLDPRAHNNTNHMALHVYGSDTQVLLMAVYDNLGKGASGAAVQNLNLMLGRDAGLGLDLAA